MTVELSFIPLNAHYSEEMSEAVDKMLAKNPKCVLDGSSDDPKLGCSSPDSVYSDRRKDSVSEEEDRGVAGT